MKNYESPQISLVIPVLGDEPGLRPLLESLPAALAGSRFETVVVGVDGAERPEALQGRSQDLAAWRTAPKGRAAQMNCGAKTARGRILLFVHADTLLPIGAGDRIRRVYADGRRIGGAFGLSFDDPDRTMRLFAQAAGLRNRLLGAPYGDQALFFRAGAFRALGGFPETPLMEDVALSRRCRRLGMRLFVAPERVVTSARGYRAQGPWRRGLRNNLLRLGLALGLLPDGEQR